MFPRFFEVGRKFLNTGYHFFLSAAGAFQAWGESHRFGATQGARKSPGAAEGGVLSFCRVSSFSPHSIVGFLFFSLHPDRLLLLPPPPALTQLNNSIYSIQFNSNRFNSLNSIQSIQLTQLFGRRLPSACLCPCDLLSIDSSAVAVWRGTWRLEDERARIYVPISCCAIRICVLSFRCF